MFFLDATARAILHGPLAIVGAAMLAGYVLVVMEVFAAVVGGAVLALVWERIPFHVLIFSVLGGPNC
jgi:hypothetical protein